ncbi:hypothetical protein VTO73DRAFT_8788 [Trametes versicolor]
MNRTLPRNHDGNGEGRRPGARVRGRAGAGQARRVMRALACAAGPWLRRGGRGFAGVGVHGKCHCQRCGCVRDQQPGLLRVGIPRSRPPLIDSSSDRDVGPQTATLTQAGRARAEAFMPWMHMYTRRQALQRGRIGEAGSGVLRSTAASSRVVAIAIAARRRARVATAAAGTHARAGRGRGTRSTATQRESRLSRTSKVVDWVNPLAGRTATNSSRLSSSTCGPSNAASSARASEIPRLGPQGCCPATEGSTVARPATLSCKITAQKTATAHPIGRSVRNISEFISRRAPEARAIRLIEPRELGKAASRQRRSQLARIGQPVPCSPQIAIPAPAPVPSGPIRARVPHGCVGAEGVRPGAPGAFLDAGGDRTITPSRSQL